MKLDREAMDVLLYIQQHEAPYTQQIVEGLEQHSSTTLRRRINTCKNHGLITMDGRKSLNTHSKRIKTVYKLTEKGRKILDEHSPSTGGDQE